MADNLDITPGTGRTIATDQIAGVDYQRIKLTWGVDGSAVDASASNPLPVTSVVTTLPALVAGTAAIGKLASNSGVTIGAVELAASQTLSTVTSLSQFAGNAINLGAGAVGTGTLRITQASDSPLVAATGATTDAVVANGAAGTIASYLRTIKDAATDTSTASPVNITQIGSNIVTTGAGAVGTGTIRVTQASDSPIVAALGTAGTAKTYTGTFVVAGTTLTRPANTTAYTANDSISDNATAGSVTAKSTNNLSDTNDHAIDIAEILLTSTDTGPGTAAIQIRCHLFNSDPTASTGVVGGDNAAWSNKQAGWVGSFSGTMRAFSDGSRGILIADEGTLRMLSPVSGAKNLYYQLQTLGAFTPSANSTTFTPTFKGFQARPA